MLNEVVTEEDCGATPAAFEINAMMEVMLSRLQEEPQTIVRDM